MSHTRKDFDMLNRVLLAGRMSRDPEVRFTPKNVPVCTVTLAVPRDFKPKNAEAETDWVDVVLWRGSAEFVGRYGAKGRLLIVDGRLQMRKYTDKDGNKRVAAEVVADHVYFGDRKETTDAAPQYSYNTNANDFEQGDDYPEDFPF